MVDEAELTPPGTMTGNRRQETRPDSTNPGEMNISQLEWRRPIELGLSVFKIQYGKLFNCRRPVN